jgi:hypothetical protein
MQPTASTHTHGTRANVKKHQQGAQATANTAMQIDSEVHHAALHSNAINPDTGRTSEYLELSKCSDGHHWIEACANEIGRLCHGHGADSNMTSGTNTMFFIPIKDMPKGRRATYIQIVCADHPEKVDPQRVRCTVGGHQVDYPGIGTTKTADLTTAKILFNSILSTPNARYMTGDLKDFYLGTPMEYYEYIRIPCTVIPDSIMLKYKLAPLIHNGYVYAEV